MLHIYGWFGLLLLMLAAHFIADYPLQGDFLSTQKNPYLAAEKRFMPWEQAMLAHCAIQAGFVLLLTGNIFLCLAELVVHFSTDIIKCAGRISFNTNQYINFGCKVLWVILLLFWN